MMADDDTVIDADTLEAWLVDEARRFSAAMEVHRVREERVDFLLGLLRTLGTPSERLLELVPEDVAQVKRKLIGLGRQPGLLDPARGLAAPAPIPPAGASGGQQPADGAGWLLEVARARLGSPKQAAVLEKIVTLARGPAAAGPLSPANITEA